MILRALAGLLLALGFASGAQAACSTPNYFSGLFHEGCLGSADLNRNNVDIYAAMTAVQHGALPLIGGTLTGALVGTSATFSGAVTVPTLIESAITTVANLDATGATDASPAFIAAAAALPANGGTLWIPRGTYLLNSNIFATGTTLVEIDSGAYFTGSGQFNTISDGLILSSHQARKIFSSTSSSTDNQWTLALSMVVGAPSAGAAFEKGPLYSAITNRTATNYTIGGVSDSCTTGCKDAVGGQFRGTVAGANPSGRAWGGSSVGEIFAGSDGYVQSWEFDITNNGVASSSYARFNSKFGTTWVNLGPNAATAAAVIVKAPSTSTFSDGFVVDKTVVTREAFALADFTTDPPTFPFAVTPTGALSAASVTSAGAITAGGVPVLTAGGGTLTTTVAATGSFAKNAAAKTIDVYLFGQGGCGAGGAMEPFATVATGGGGGGPGLRIAKTFLASDFPTTVTLTFSTACTGGLGATSNGAGASPVAGANVVMTGSGIPTHSAFGGGSGEGGKNNSATGGGGSGGSSSAGGNGTGGAGGSAGGNVGLSAGGAAGGSGAAGTAATNVNSILGAGGGAGGASLTAGTAGGASGWCGAGGSGGTLLAASATAGGNGGTAWDQGQVAGGSTGASGGNGAAPSAVGNGQLTGGTGAAGGGAATGGAGGNGGSTGTIPCVGGGGGGGGTTKGGDGSTGGRALAVFVEHL